MVRWFVMYLYIIQDRRCRTVHKKENYYNIDTHTHTMCDNLIPINIELQCMWFLFRFFTSCFFFIFFFCFWMVFIWNSRYTISFNVFMSILLFHQSHISQTHSKIAKKFIISHVHKNNIVRHSNIHFIPFHS